MGRFFFKIMYNNLIFINKIKINNNHMTKEITRHNLSSILNNNKMVIMDFWANWCGPCRTLSPILEDISNNNKDIMIGKVNIDDNAELASMYNVKSIPMLVFIKNGKVSNRSIGGINSLKLQSMINSFKTDG